MCGLLAAICLCGSGTASRACERDLVSVHITFDASIKSARMKATIMDEAAAIWRDYGVDLEWVEMDCAVAPSIDVAIERSMRDDGTHQVLGRATILDSIPTGPVRISYEAVEALLDQKAMVTSVSYDRVVGIAIGRVLAHELGHVLLGSPGYHDNEGLMRAKFLPDDLARPERTRFRLAPFSVERLRARRVCAQ
jgi:hypothetical protein